MVIIAVMAATIELMMITRKSRNLFSIKDAFQQDQAYSNIVQTGFENPLPPFWTPLYKQGECLQYLRSRFGQTKKIETEKISLLERRYIGVGKKCI